MPLTMDRDAPLSLGNVCDHVNLSPIQCHSCAIESNVFSIASVIVLIARILSLELSTRQRTNDVDKLTPPRHLNRYRIFRRQLVDNTIVYDHDLDVLHSSLDALNSVVFVYVAEFLLHH